MIITLSPRSMSQGNQAASSSFPPLALHLLASTRVSNPEWLEGRSPIQRSWAGKSNAQPQTSATCFWCLWFRSLYMHGGVWGRHGPCLEGEGEKGTNEKAGKRRSIIGSDSHQHPGHPARLQCLASGCADVLCSRKPRRHPHSTLQHGICTGRPTRSDLLPLCPLLPGEAITPEGTPREDDTGYWVLRV